MGFWATGQRAGSQVCEQLQPRQRAPGRGLVREPASFKCMGKSSPSTHRHWLLMPMVPSNPRKWLSQVPPCPELVLAPLIWFHQRSERCPGYLVSATPHPTLTLRKQSQPTVWGGREGHNGEGAPREDLGEEGNFLSAQAQERGHMNQGWA